MYELKTDSLYLDKKNKKKCITYVEKIYYFTIIIIFLTILSAAMTINDRNIINNSIASEIIEEKEYLEYIKNDYVFYKNTTYILIYSSIILSGVLLFLLGLNRFSILFKEDKDKIKLVMSRFTTMELLKKWF
jgi:TRAP-type C4-dicarboxylate transport system permease small subunit